MKKDTIYIKVITDYLDGVDRDFSNIYLLGSKALIFDYLKRYIKKYPERSEEVTKILDNFDLLKSGKYTFDNLVKVLNKHIENYSSRYVEIVLNIITKDENAAIDYLKDNKITLTNLKSVLKQFETKYNNQTDEINYLNKIFSKYEKILEEKSKKSKKYINISLFDSSRDHLVMRFKCLYISKLSIEEFCSLTGESVSSIRTYCLDKLNDKNFKDNAKEILDRKSSKEFYTELMNIAYEIDTNKEFDAVDYYNMTRLKTSDYRDIIQNMLLKEDFIRVIKKINETVKIKNNVSKTNE